MLGGIHHCFCYLLQCVRPDIEEVRMKEYVLSILAVATVGSLILILAPEGEGGGIRKHISLIVGLATILVIISPISKALEAIREVDLDEVKDNAYGPEEYESIFYTLHCHAVRP